VGEGLGVRAAFTIGRRRELKRRAKLPRAGQAKDRSRLATGRISCCITISSSSST